MPPDSHRAWFRFAARLRFVVIAISVATFFVVLWVTATPRPDTEELLDAAHRGDVREVRHLLSAGSPVNGVDETGVTPLIEAARAGGAETAVELLDHGADVRARSPVYGTALMQAALNGDADVCRLLLQHGANPNARTNQRSTALWWAALSAGQPQPQVTSILIAAGADVDARCIDGNTPLMAAAAAGKFEDVRLLIDAGANVSTMDDKGMTALAYAEADENTAIAKILRKAERNAVPPPEPTATATTTTTAR